MKILGLPDTRITRLRRRKKTACAS